MNDFGALCLVVSVGLISFSILQTVYYIYLKKPLNLELGRYSLFANVGIIFLAILTLLIQLIRTDLSNHYVVMHSNKYLPMFYKLTSLWSGSSGSLLFWNFLLSIFVSICIIQTRKFVSFRVSVLILSLAVISWFFSFIAVFYSDAQPFKEFFPEATTGRGLNPLLQHWAMIIHPPILYVGYVSFAVPFSIAMAALISKNISEDWLQYVRKWGIFSWFFLGCGILLGSKWAYEELGWGGYWAWDPVENASLMPFLLSTAFLHSMIIQERRKMLKFWNMFLIILSFHFSLLGTWITRSGVLEGPHSFSKSEIGVPFIIYIGISFVFYSLFLIKNRFDLTSDKNIENLTSKEGSFLINNYVLVISTFAILLGVFSPLIYSTEFKSPWFNSWSVPLGILLLIAMGFSPLLAWRKSVESVFFQTILKPLVSSLITSILIYAYITYNYSFENYSNKDFLNEVYSFLVIFFGLFAIFGIIQEYYRGIKIRKKNYPEENFVNSIFQMVNKNKRKYGGYLVHLSIILLFIGYSGNSFKKNTALRFIYTVEKITDEEIRYTCNDVGIVDDYELVGTEFNLKPIYGNSNILELQNITISEEANFILKKKSKIIEKMTSERRFYPQVSHLSGNFESYIPTSEPDIASFLNEDFYIQLGAVEHVENGRENPDLPYYFAEYLFSMKDKEMAKIPEILKNIPSTLIINVEIWINPFVRFIWIGSILFFLSGLLLILPTGEKFV